LDCLSCGYENNSTTAHCKHCGINLSYTLDYAGFWRRVIAHIIDNLIIIITLGPFNIFLYIAFGNGEITEIIHNILAVIISWLYFAYMESSNRQATLGKRALKIKVTDTNGNKISFARATGRYFAKFISLIILGIGFIIAAFTPKKQALHDYCAGCLVIKE